MGEKPRENSRDGGNEREYGDLAFDIDYKSGWEKKTKGRHPEG